MTTGGLKREGWEVRPHGAVGQTFNGKSCSAWEARPIVLADGANLTLCEQLFEKVGRKIKLGRWTHPHKQQKQKSVDSGAFLADY